MREMAGSFCYSFPIIILELCAIIGLHFQAKACDTLVSKPLGYVTPSKDMMLQVGSSFSINCTLYPDNVSKLYPHGVSSKDIRFKFIPKFGVRTEWIKTEEIDYIDEFTARLKMDNLTMNNNGKYTCYLSVPRASGKGHRNSLVCGTAVTVGYPPLDIEGEDLNCIGRNWQNMTCIWKVRNNTIPTVYKFYYSYIGQGSPEIECKPYKNIANQCVMTVKANESANEGFYRQVGKFYYFTIRGENMFGTSENKFQLNHYNYVVPNKPDKFVVDEVGQRKMKLRWLTPAGMEGFPVGLRYQIAFQSQWDKKDEWMVLSTEDISIELHGLLPYTIYTLKIRCASNSFEDGQRILWSNYSTIQRRTEPDVPRTAPNTTAGMFEDHWYNHSTRSVILYWKPVMPSLRNGEDFKYYVSYSKTENKQKRAAEISEDTRITTEFSVQYKNLDLNSDYRFDIRVGNKEGSLPDVYSSIFVNDKENSLGKPTNFYAKLQANHIYQLVWKPPTHNSHLVKSYTVFWCKQRPKYLYHRCMSPMNWVNVSADENKVSLFVPDVKNTYYQFAVSSNGESSSSGLIWTECPNGATNKVSSVMAAAKHPSSLLVSWKSTCVQEAIIKSYKVLYCKASSELENSCSGPTLKKDTKGSSILLKNLDFYTRYIIRVSYVHEDNVESEPSEPTSARTLEGIPEPVDAPTVLKTTNSSIVISWIPTKRPNGIITKYKILYNSNIKEVPITSETPFQATLDKDIVAYENYEISVLACTISGCSRPEKRRNLRTDIGVPGIIEAPRFEVINATFVRVYWKKPKFPNGALNMVELKITWKEQKNETKTEFYKFTKWMNWSYIAIDCPLFTNEDDLQLYNITVRAVNLKGKETLYGQWSKKTRVNMCFEAAEALAVGFIIGVTVGGSLALSILLLLLYFVIRWTIQKMDEARAIKVQLPKGLESNGMTSLNTYKDFSNGLKSAKLSNGNGPQNFGQYKPLIPNDPTNDYQLQKNRHESGDSAYSSNSTNELLRKRERNSSNHSGENSDLGGGNDCLMSNIGGKTHLSNHSNDSGLHCDLDNSQPSPEPVFLDSSPNFKLRGSPQDSSLKFKTPSLPIVNESQDHENSPDDHSQNTEVSDDSGTAEMTNDNKLNQYSKFAHYHDDKLKDVDSSFPNSPTVGLALTDGLGNGSPYCKLGINQLRGVYVPSHPGTASFLSKNSRNIAGSEPNIADVDSPGDFDSGNSSAVNALLPPYTRLGLASSHTDVSSNNIPMSYSKFGFASGSQNGSSHDPYIPVNNFLKLNGNTSPKVYPAAPYSKFGLLNIPTNDNVNANPSNPYLSNYPIQKWDIPKPCNPGYVTIDRAEVPFGMNPKSNQFDADKVNKVTEFDEGYSRVSATPQDILPIPQDIDHLEESEPILCIQPTNQATGAIPKCSKSAKGNQLKASDNACNGYIPNNSIPLVHSVGLAVPTPTNSYLDSSKNNYSRPDLGSDADTLLVDPTDKDCHTTNGLGLNTVDQTATSTPKSSPQLSPAQLPKIAANPNCYVPYEPTANQDTSLLSSKSNGYVSMPSTGIISPSNKNNNQPLSCANLQPSLTFI